MNNLPLEHIRVGNLIWYSGSTSMFSWDCPAEIIEVNTEGRWFRVKSLDDLKEQTQCYSFDVEEHSNESRQSMRVPSDNTVSEYVLSAHHAAVRARNAAQEKLTASQALMGDFERYLARFDIFSKDAV